MSELTFNEEKFQEMMGRLCDAVPDDVSSIEELSLYYDIFKKGYKYAIEKACEWLEENMEYWLGDYNLAEGELEENQLYYSAMLQELRKAMEE